MLERFSWQRYRPLYTLVAIYLAIQFVLRLCLWWSFGPAADVRALDLVWIIPAGAINDLVQAAYLSFPFAAFIFLAPDRIYRSRPIRWPVAILAIATIFGFLYLGPTEYYFFEEFDARYNLVAVNYLMYPTEVFIDIRESYPVGKIMVACAAAALGIFWLHRRYLLAGFATPVRLRERLWPFVLHGAFLLLAIAFYTTGSLSFSRNRVANELAQNGHSSFFRALRTSEIEYPTYYATRPHGENMARLLAQLKQGGGQFSRLDAGRLDRTFAANPAGLGRLNVVVVMCESFGAEFSKLHGSDRDFMPNFDRLAQQGIWFSNAYASGTRTVRGLEAITSSFPPTPVESIVRRPGNDHLATWGKVMRGAGYHTSFLYGGYGYFDNMNAFYAANDYEVLDREKIDTVRFANIWGVSDEDLFDLALNHFDALAATRQPFFAQIMTTSNHKPFTFRADLPGIPATGGGRKAGVLYADFAIGYFIREAKKRPWFKDTVFVIVADHGARVYGKVEIPLRTYEIPLTIYSPAHIAPRRVDALMGQIDIAPTVLGLLGLAYTAPFFGQNVLGSPGPRIALFNHNTDVALLRGNDILVLGMHKKITQYLYDKSANTFTPAPPDTELASLAIAYFQTAYEQYRAHQYE
jgi:phosphoglycerol transferase MdoB-like AlkP superfamily enzyme